MTASQEEQFKQYQEWARRQDEQSKQKKAKDKGHGLRDKLAQEYDESPVFKGIAWVLFAGVISAIGVVAWLNIAPYVALFQGFGAGENWLTGLLGTITETWGKYVLTLAGILLWALTQILQCLWLIIRNDRRSMKAAVHLARSSQLSAKDSDTRVTRKVIRRHNNVPFFFLRWSGLLSLGATAFDFMMNFGQYPPAKDFGQFLFALTTGMWNLINTENLTKLLVSVLLFELLLILAMVLGQWIWSSKSAEKFQGAE